MPSSRRRSGVLLHPTSLPGRFPIGDLGPAADRFLDRLAAAGQSLWQVLPLGPTGLGDSPYGALSAFAGNPLLISPERLVEDGLLDAGELGPEPTAIDRVDYSEARRVKAELLRLAFERFEAGRAPALTEESVAWAAAPEIARWLGDWALFAALRSAPRRTDLAGVAGSAAPARARGARCGAPRTRPAPALPRLPPVPVRPPVAAPAARGGRARRRALSATCRSTSLPTRSTSGRDATCSSSTAKGARRWSRACRPTTSAPTASSGATRSIAGRRWRPTATPGGSSGCAPTCAGSTCSGSTTSAASPPTGRCPRRRTDGARRALGRRARRADSSRALRAALGPLPLVAEDLGVITDDVDRPAPSLRPARHGDPAVRIRGSRTSSFQPHRLEPHSVVYTGTHDNDTTPGWFGGDQRHDPAAGARLSRLRRRRARPGRSCARRSPRSSRSPSCRCRTCSGSARRRA